MSKRKMSHDFANVPSVRYNRSRQVLSHDIKTTMNLGTLYPLDIQEVLPGDSFKQTNTAVIRATSAFIKPVMDNLYMDVFHFFVPLRLVYKDAQDIFGRSSPSMYTDGQLSSMPTIAQSFTVPQKSVGDYLGLPVDVEIPQGEISVAPFRAFALTYNTWFRDENIINETFVQDGVWNSSEKPNSNVWSATNYFGMCPKVSKRADYFTSCLPAPQKGQGVTLPLGSVAKLQPATDMYSFDPSGQMGDKFKSDTLRLRQSGNPLSIGSNYVMRGFTSDGTNLNPYFDSSSAGQGSVSGYINGTNLYADLTNATAVSVNDLRFAFQTQKMLEKDARFGSRYNEYLLGHFGVSNPDARLQLPEFLGGGRIPLNIQQVAQTSSSNESSALADVAGFSLSNGKSRFNKGFTEHGYVLTVACIRQFHTYSQGINKMWFRKDRVDFYDPLYANLGEQPVYTREIFADLPNDRFEDVFGYNEAWADYRYAPSRITSQMRPQATDSLDVWHFGDDYVNAPVLSPDFIEETPIYLDRTLSVPSDSQDQFIVDMDVQCSAIRVMPVFSEPGLIDHH